MRKFFGIVFASSLVFAFAAESGAQVAGSPRKWPHESSDLPADPRIRFGALKNGLRYAFVHQPLEEDSSVHLRLHVDVGSGVEQESELGMAHFVEHMAFNGTRGFKAGTLIDWFQNHGVRFGRDQNASTSFDQTVYELDLPDAENERLKKAFAWMRDVADGLLFEEKEVAAEKGVVDAEERERASAEQRIFARLEKQLVDGTLAPKRWPIGKKSARDRFTAASCKAFYAKWYRPELMTLVVVGNLPGVDVEALIKESFDAMPVRKDPVPPRPTTGTAKVSARSFCVFDKEATGCRLFAGKVRPAVDEPDTVKARQQRMIRNTALGIVGERLTWIAQKTGGPIDHATFSHWNFEDAVEGTALSVTCPIARWSEALALASSELRRALAEGFNRAEGQTVFARLSEYCAVEPQADRLPMSEYLGELLAAARGGHVPVDEVAGRRLMKPVLAEINVERLHQELVAAWNEGELYLFATGGLDLGTDAKEVEAKLKQAFEGPPATAVASGGAKPEDSEDSAENDAEEPLEFLYKARGASGKVVDSSQDQDLQLIKLEFENGVRAVLHPTAQQNPGAAIVVRVGDGFLALDPSECDVGWVANQVFLQSGLGEHTYAQLQKLLEKNKLAFGFDVSLDSCFFSGSSAPDDFQRLCEVICAYIKDPGWRPEAFATFNGNLPRFYESMERGFTGPLSQFEKELHGNDARFGTPDRALVESFLLDTLKEFLQPQLDEGPIEIAVVAGMDPNAIVNILSRTFALLPKRGEAEDRSERLASPPVRGGLKFRREIETAEKKANVAIVYPTGDGIDPKRRHELEFLADVLDNRVRIEIREKKGAAYSPNVWADLSELLPGVGCIRIGVECDPAKVDAVTNSCFAIGDALAKNGIKQDEFEQVRTIALAQLEQQKKQDGYWLDGLARAFSDEASLAELRDAKKNLEAVTLESVNALAKESLARAKASTAVIVPKKAPKKS